MSHWDTVREVAGSLPGAEESTTYGKPAFKVKGKLFVWVSPDAAAEDCIRQREAREARRVDGHVALARMLEDQHACLGPERRDVRADADRQRALAARAEGALRGGCLRWRHAPTLAGMEFRPPAPVGPVFWRRCIGPRANARETQANLS